MKVGDVVRIREKLCFGVCNKPEAVGQIGVVIAEAKRLHQLAAVVMVLGEVVQFDRDELEVIDNENR